MKNTRIQLEVNGQEIPLNPFVKNLFQQIILGMISVLKGVKSARRIELKIEIPGPGTSRPKKGGSRRPADG